MSIITCPKEYIEFANLLADESSEIILKYFRSELDIESKSDNSPVTIADKETETLIREKILKKYKNHGILGEEHKNINLDNEFVWVIDPIDGTRSFIAGHKDFGTLISLLHNQTPILGIINCPAHNERWVGICNEATTLNGSKVSTSNKKNISESYAFTSGLYFENEKFKNNFDKIIKKTKYYRFGGDCYMYGMLASGLIDIVVEDTLKNWDYMALIPVIEGSGGIVSDSSGKKINLKSDGSFVASCTQIVHEQVIKILNS
tara:strand:+ start:234 stop:1016 length:783 start_codon:yes stop_codon:yes gene_type:complete